MPSPLCGRRSGSYKFIYFGDQWDGRWRRRQQLAYRLARLSGVEQVVYIEFPLTLTSLLRFLAGKADSEATVRWRRALKMGLTPQLDGVQIITSICPLPLFHLSSLSGLNELILDRSTRKLIERHLTAAGTPDVITVLWISHPFAANQIGKWGEEFVVYDCTERFSEFEDWAHIKKEAESRDVSITEKADLVLTQTVPHLEQKKKINSNTYLVPNAVGYDIFAASGNDADLSDTWGIQRPILVYVGNIHYRLDFDLLFYLAHDSHYSLVFIGPATDSREVSQLEACDRVYFVGEKPYPAIPQYLHYADVCLIPFLTHGVTESESPIKLFDYLASGKPIVSTAIPGVKDFSEVIFIARNHDDFCAKVECALREDDALLSQRRQELAQKNSWEKRVQQIWTLINSQVASGEQKRE